jgi:hypothetical protein
VKIYTGQVPEPSPGSDAALDRGCTCPVVDNDGGAGYYLQQGIFIITVGCPIHSPRPAHTPDCACWLCIGAYGPPNERTPKE